MSNISFLDNVNLDTIEEIDKLKVNEIAKKISEDIFAELQEYNISKEELYEAITKVNMFKVKFKDDICGQYYYQTNSIYLNDNFDINKRDSSIYHEIIHYLQTEFGKNNNVLRMGLLKFSKIFKIKKGEALNEGAVQYIASMIAKTKPKNIKYFNLEFTTPSSNYYPIETAIIRQMMYFTGTYPLIYSTLFSNDIFEKTFSCIATQEAYNDIDKQLKKVIQLQENVSKIYLKLYDKDIRENEKVNCLNNIKKIKDIVREKTLDIQKIIYVNAFSNSLENIHNLADIENLKNSLENFQNYIIQFEGNTAYLEFKEIINKELNRKAEYLHAYGNFALALKVKQEIINLPKVNNINIFKVMMNKVKILMEMRFKLKRTSKEELYY